MATAKQRQPFGMFFVEVDPNSKFEKLMGIATMAPYFIVCALVVLSARCRELMTLAWLAGQLLNEVANFVLKRLLKQPRPAGAPRVGMDESGMPSNHAQFMGFFLAMSLLVLFFRLRGYIPFLKLLAAVGCTTLAAIVCYSRLLFGFHTFDQVFVGFLIGFLLGCCWYSFSRSSLFPHFRSVADSDLGRLLMLRDATDVANVLEFEYAGYARECKKK